VSFEQLAFVGEGLIFAAGLLVKIMHKQHIHNV
jgi:hypothetical protein